MERNKVRTIIPLYLASALPFLLHSGDLELPARAVAKVLPLCVLLLALMKSILTGAGRDRSTAPYITALLFCIIGDVVGEMKFKLWGLSAFVWQITAFAAGQIMFALSFAHHHVRIRRFSPVRAALCLVITAWMVYVGILISPGLHGVMKVATECYMLIISLMGIACVLQRRKLWWCLVSGALLFIASDSAIAFRCFTEDIRPEAHFIMTTYYAALLLFSIPLIFSSDRSA